MNRTGEPAILVTRAEEVLGEAWEDYARAVSASGGVPLVADLAAPGAIPDFDGLLVTAGVDVAPDRYGQSPGPYVQESNPGRDRFEEDLLREASRRDIPILAICRGHQLFNTSRGGTLHQHLAEREPHRARHGADPGTIASGWHEVHVTRGSLLHRITGRERLVTNSRHHQAVLTGTVAPGLEISATAAQDVVEALEDPGLNWCLSVQWHPERTEMFADRAHRSASVELFRAFVAACREPAATAR